MIFNAELLFFFFTITLGLFIFFINRFFPDYLEYCACTLPVFLNLFVISHIYIFGIRTTIAEPIGVALFLINILLPLENRSKLSTALALQSALIALICICGLLLEGSSKFYFGLGNDSLRFSILLPLLGSTIMSVFSLILSLYVERKFYVYLITKKIKTHTAQIISLSMGQIFDTALFTIFLGVLLNVNAYITHNGEHIYILDAFQLFTSALTIKIICTLIYNVFLFLNYKINSNKT